MSNWENVNIINWKIKNSNTGTSLLSDVIEEKFKSFFIPETPKTNKGLFW